MHSGLLIGTESRGRKGYITFVHGPVVFADTKTFSIDLL